MKQRQITDHIDGPRKEAPGRRRSRGRALMGLLFCCGSLITALAGSGIDPAAGPRRLSTQAAQKDAKPPANGGDRERRRKAYLLYAQAITEAQKGNPYRAMQTLSQVAQLDPTSPIPHVTLAEFQYRLRNTKEAQREAKIALSIDPQSPEAHSILGRIQRDQALSAGDRKKARQAIVEYRYVIEKDELNSEAWYSLAQLYELTDQQDEMINALTRLTSNDPTADRAFYVLAGHYFSKGKYRQAAENASRALSVQYNPDYAVLLARALVAQGQTVEALRIYREARQRNASNPELDVWYADALVNAGQYEEAKTILQKILSSNPRKVDAVRLLAEAYRRSGERQKAIDTLSNALPGIDVTESLGMQLILARIYEEMGSVDQAVQTYRNMLDVILNPDGTVSPQSVQASEIVLGRMAMAYRQAGRRQQALRALEEMKKVLGPTNPQADLLILDTMMDEQKYEQALLKARDSAQRFPDKREFRELEAQILGRLGRVDEAIDLLDGLLTNSFEDLEVLAFKAGVLTDAERYREAKIALEEGLRRDPKNNGLLVQLSMVQEKLNQPNEAESTLRAILQRDPDNPTVLNNLGYYLAERGERLEEALELTQRAVNIEPTEGSFLDSLGWVHFQLNQLDEAQHYLQQALDLKPRDATIHEHVGDLYLQQGRLDQARRSFQRALEFARENDQSERIRQKLQKLTGEPK